MAVAKDAFYWIQLRTALTAGTWESNAPAKAPNGVHLTWSELFRKFRKHCSKHSGETLFDYVVLSAYTNWYQTLLKQRHKCIRCESYYAEVRRQRRIWTVMRTGLSKNLS